MSRRVVGAGAAFGQAPRRSVRTALLILIVAAHLAAILALLAPASPLLESPTTERTLSLFNVALPPPPPIPPPPLPPPVTKPTLKALRASEGGAPGRRRERLAPPTANDRAATPMRMDATITTDALPLPAVGRVVDAAKIDLGLATVAATGGGGTEGQGAGTGRGTGHGDGDGFARYGRARWITKPRDADFLRVWPTRDVDGKRVRQNGWAYLACRVRPDGQPHDCQTLYEQPASIGMGSAAIDVATRSRVRPVFRNNAALYDLPVLIPIIFGPQMVRIPRVSAEASALPAR